MATKLEELTGKLEEVLALAKEEVVEFAKGRKVAAGRIRKLAQQSKSLWQAVRVETMAQLKALPTKKRGAKG
jgi:hypothetical protein